MPDLKTLINQQIELLETLKVQLESELHLISSRDPESLTNLVNDKANTLDQIAELDNTIKQQYASTESTILRDELNPLFEKANGLIEECKYRTEVNAKAVEQGQLRLEHLRNLLLEARAKESLTYDKSGKPKGGSSLKGVKA